MQSPVPFNVVKDVQSIVKIDQIRAATQQHVLAIVDGRAGARIGQRCRSAAKSLAALDENGPFAGFGDADSSSNTRQPASNDRNAPLHTGALACLDAASPPCVTNLASHLARSAMAPL